MPLGDWIYSRLSGDTAITDVVGDAIYPDQAPQLAPSPVVIFAYQYGVVRIRAIKHSHVSEVTYLVRVVGDGMSFDEIKPVADRFTPLMTVPQGGVDIGGIRIMSSWLFQPSQRRDAADGHPQVYLGAFYTFAIKQVVS